MYEVRKLDSEDAAAWAELCHEAVEHHPFAFGAPLPDNPAMLVDTFRIVTSRGDDMILGAFTDTSLIGIVGIRRHPAEKQRHKADLWGMYVTTSHRRNGVGELLVHAAIEQAREWPGITQVQLAVSEVAVEAKRLYGKVGFREWGREPRALCCQGRCVDYWHMVFQLLK